MRLLMLLGLGLCAAAMAQENPPPARLPNGPPNGSYAIPPGAGTVKDPANRPDFAGVWMRAEGLTHPDQSKIFPFMTAAGLADFKKHIVAHDFHVPWSNCEPTAFPAIITEMGMPVEFVQTPGRLMLLTADGENHSIWTDGSQHFDTPPGGTYGGNAIGHWEGGTLVAETTGLRSDNDVVMGLPAGTEDMKVQERLSLTADGRLKDEITVSGPDFLAKPYRYTQYFKRVAGVRLGEFVCLPSKNRDTGTTLDLTPPS